MLVPLLPPNEAAQPLPVSTTSRPDLHSFNFTVENDELSWNRVPLIQLIEQHGTPLKLTYLPQISKHIQHVKSIFAKAMARHRFRGGHTYCYCTKTSHFRFVLDEVLKNDTHLELSSAFDVSIVQELYRSGKINKSTYIICNGYKQPQYLERIGELIEAEFNVVPIIDSLREIGTYEHVHAREVNIGIRIATDEVQSTLFRTSRLGVRYSEVCELYRTRIQHHPKLRLRMLHFHINTGIQNTGYYWSELACFVHKYCKLRKICPSLDSIDIGGGLPIAHSLDFTYPYDGIVDQIIETISKICTRNHVAVPHLFTEFGGYTVGESGATIYQVIEQKQQNAKEMWYMINGSFITQLPDTWGKKESFICLPINNWSYPRRNVLLGGLTCDAQDFYADGPDRQHVSMPQYDEYREDQYVGLFHTGAYQEELSGYGGVSHCLIPAPKHVVVESDGNGRWKSCLFAPEQGSESMMRLLGYTEEKMMFSNDLDVLGSDCIPRHVCAPER
ncbi:Orn/DAP/Arg decarboxylase 2 [Ophiobolus disseminans]|uniref:Arginine decarboxylase n=1 Tax=Ophiobolus disseminans TaxID=1469910 RepID=A0A6A6ZHF2_9PLEO|nr:Orn/DAP/Arg decarboxylase 2 [Ophiobolus disseminans]